jgi:hypothetical protein
MTLLSFTKGCRDNPLFQETILDSLHRPDEPEFE